MLARPARLKRTVPSLCVLPLSVAGPPSIIIVAAGTRTLDSVNSMRPLTCSNGKNSSSLSTRLLKNW